MLVQKDINIEKERSQGEILKMLARKFRGQKEAAEEKISSLLKDNSKELEIEAIDAKFKEGDQKWTFGKDGLERLGWVGRGLGWVDLTFQPTVTSTPGNKRHKRSKREHAVVPTVDPTVPKVDPTVPTGDPTVPMGDPAVVPTVSARPPPAFSFAQPAGWLGTGIVTASNHCFHFSSPEPVEGSYEPFFWG
jgi:hypothetical protein